MTRDEFEAAIWRNVDATTPLAAVDRILEAADAFAATTAATALQVNGTRYALPAVHYQNPAFPEPSCGYGRGIKDPRLTTDPGQVTCRGCKRSAAYKNALALTEAVAS